MWTPLMSVTLAFPYILHIAISYGRKHCMEAKSLDSSPHDVGSNPSSLFIGFFLSKMLLIIVFTLED